jgi:hypothetical protein
MQEGFSRCGSILIGFVECQQQRKVTIEWLPERPREIAHE